MSTTRILQFTGADLRVTKLGVSSNVEVGSANLFVDTSTGRVGVGTGTPVAPLEIVAPDMNSGTVGDVQVISRHSGADGVLNIFARLVSTGEEEIGLQTQIDNRSFETDIANGFAYSADHRYKLLLQPFKGRVGIGLTDPGTPLHVSSPNFVSDAVGPAASANTVVRFSSTESDSTLLFGLSDTGSYVSSFSKTGFATERNLILNANGGNVGIGTTNPTYKMHVHTTASESNSQLFLQSADRYASMYMKDDTGGVIVQNDQGDLRIVAGYDVNDAGGSEKLRVAGSTGNVGIGVTDSTYKLRVNGTARVDSTLAAGSRMFMKSGAFSASDNDSFVLPIDVVTGTGGACILFGMSVNYSAGSSTRAAVWMLRGYYSGTWASGAATNISNLNNMTGVTTFADDGNGALKVTVSDGGNYEWWAISTSAA